MSIKRTTGFTLHPNKQPRLRNQNNGIILTHMVDLLDATKTSNTNMLYDISDVNQYNEHIFYFRRDLGYEHYGYHYFFETYINEIFGYMGCSLSNRSEYLIDLTKKEILNKIYQDYLLVVINGNLSQDMMEKVMYTKIAYQLAGYMSYENMKLDKLVYLNDIIDKEKAEKSNYLFAPMTHFDRSIFQRELLRFKAK